MGILLWSCALAIVVLVGAGVAVRLAPEDAAIWHVDPLTAQSSGKPNEYWVLPGGPEASREGEAARVYPVSPRDLAQAFEAVALAAPRTTKIAGSPEDGWMTYVQRSRVFGFPDYVSVRVVPTEGADGAMLAIFSRARFGHSDMGVNATRIRAWQSAVEARLGRGEA